MTKFFKLTKKTPFCGHFSTKGNFSYKLWLSTTAVVPQHLNVKIQSRAKYYSVTISMQKSFTQSAQFRLFHLCVLELVNLKIMQSDWPRAFWHISQEPDFSQVWN